MTTHSMELVRRIGELKHDRNAIILAHNYQRPEVQEIADFTGDSLELSRIAESARESVIVFCGVRFMAETAAILCPDKRVLLPVLEAGCALAGTATAMQVWRMKQLHPLAVVVAYVNTSAAVKAESDLCCTSGNAVEVLRSVEPGHPIIFVSDRKRGVCQVRENRGQTLFTLVYGRAIAQHVDAVEKKPLFHFFPGSRAYSIGTPGCNFRCRWCQNWEISQTPREQHLIAGQELRPEQIVVAAQRAGSRSIAYTYTEPTIFFEYAYETARWARAAGIANVFVTNGYLSRQALETFQPLLDAANVDLKAFRDETYRNDTGARLQPVLDTMKRMKQLGVWLEVTTLVIPGINDDPQELRDAADFVAQELGVATPWHISRFFPDYQMTAVPPTPVATLRRAEQIGRDAGLQYVYVGNVREDADTYCHACGELLIRRALMAVSENRVQLESRCPRCGATVAGVGMTYRNPST